MVGEEMNAIKIKRAYEKPEEQDGYRILVDKIWPRGIKKEDLELTEWKKEMAPSSKLRKDFGHEPKKFDWFKDQYKKELDENEKTAAFLNKLNDFLKKSDVTLVYGAKDQEHNQALVLKEYAEEKIKKKIEEKE